MGTDGSEDAENHVMFSSHLASQSTLGAHPAPSMPVRRWSDDRMLRCCITRIDGFYAGAWSSLNGGRLKPPSDNLIT